VLAWKIVGNPKAQMSRKRVDVNSATNDSPLKSLIKGLPLIGATARKLAHLPVVMRARRLTFTGSTAFWEATYRKGVARQACPGSRGRLAEFKAEILNEFVRRQNIRMVIEFGCGDGSQLQLGQYPEYVGVDVAASAIAVCKSRFAHDSSKRFYRADALPEDMAQFDLALSLDVIYHLIEDDVFEAHMKRLFGSSRRYVAIYASNHDAWVEAFHVRHRKFTVWIEEKARGWRPDGFVANRFPFDPSCPNDTSFANFYFYARQAPDTSSEAGTPR
jgi:hypothetical protein